MTVNEIVKGSYYTSKKTGKKWEVDTVYNCGTVILVADPDRGWMCDTRRIKLVSLKRFYDLIHEEE